MAAKVPNKAELRAKAETLAEKYNAAMLAAKYEAAVKISAEIEEAVNEYTSLARTEVFNALKATEDPMLEAVKTLTYKSIRVKDTKAGDDKVPVRTIEEVDKPIDLLKLHKHCGGEGIGRDKNWVFKVEKFNFLMTAAKAVDLGIDPKAINDSYAMADISKSIDLGKTPCSKTNILKTLQAIITSMIGEEYKATSHDVAFLFSVFSRKNRAALTVTCANHKYMRQYLAEICHRIVLNKTYNIDYKKAK